MSSYPPCNLVKHQAACGIIGSYVTIPGIYIFTIHAIKNIVHITSPNIFKAFAPFLNLSFILILIYFIKI